MKKLMLMIVAVLFTVTMFGQTFKVGQHYQGGVVFYIDATGQHGLIAPLTGYIPILRANAQGLYANQCMWGAAPKEGLGTDTKIGSGKVNTELILAKKSEILPYITAAEYCSKFSITEGETIYKDWFLPSKDEFVELLKAISSIKDIGWIGTDPNINWRWYRSSYFHARFWTSSECVKGDKFLGGKLIPDNILKYYVWIMQFGYMLPESKGQAVYILPIHSF